jgi:predicted dehydrogenase
MSLLKVAVIGIGGIGALHAGIVASLPGCSLVAAVDREPRLVRVASAAVPTIHFYTDAREMVDEQRPDVVYICTPPTTHLALVQEMLLHPHRPRALFVEKPLATNTKEAESMANLARKFGTLTGVGFQRRFLPTIRKARELVASGAIGELLLVRGHHFSASVFEAGEGWRFQPESGGVTLDLGVHLLDAMMSILGEPEVLGGRTLRMFSASCEDYASALLRFETVPLALFEVGWSMWGFNPSDFRIELFGTQGWIWVNQDEVVVTARTEPTSTQTSTRTFRTAELVGRLPILLGSVENVLIDVDFIEAVSSGKAPQVTFEAGLRVSRVLDGIRGGGRGTN